MKTQDPVHYRIRRETLLQHARHLFATKGYAETSMEDIASADDMQKASLYHYFESKQQILQEMVNLEVSRWWTVRLKDYETGSDLAETLRLIGTLFLKDLEDPARREFFRIIHFESHKNPAIQKALKESPTHNRAGFYAVFAKHLQGKLPEKRIAMFMTQFMGALIHYASLSRLREENLCYEPLDDAQYIEQLVSIFVQGLGASQIDRSVA